MRDADAMTVYRLGRIAFSIRGDHPVASCLRDEFAPLEVYADEETLRFDFVDELESMPGASHASPVRVLANRYATEDGGLAYQVARIGTTTEVRLRPAQGSWKQRVAPATVLRVRDWNHLTHEETLAKNFVYNVFDYISQVVQLPVGQSYLHASSFERDGRAVALIAWGGIGKTSAMLKLVLEDGWRFLSDDLVAIDVDGVLSRSPKRLQVYAYNVRGQDALRRRLMRDRSAIDRFAWTLRHCLHGPKRVRRRVSAERLLGPDSVAQSARLAHAFFLERVDTRDIAMHPLSVEELARRAAMTLLRELQPFVDISVAMYSGEQQAILPTVSEMYEASRAVLLHAFAGVQPYRITLPLAAGPDDVAAFLRTTLADLPAPRT